MLNILKVAFSLKEKINKSGSANSSNCPNNTGLFIMEICPVKHEVLENVGLGSLTPRILTNRRWA